MMINEYLIKRNEKLKKDNLKENYIFGVIFGIVLSYLNLILYFSTKTYDKILFIELGDIYLFGMALGAIIVLLTTIHPNILNFLFKFIRFFGEKVFFVFLELILFIIYFILVIPIGIIVRIFEFRNNSKITTNFEEYDSTFSSCNSQNKLIKFLNILKSIVNGRYAFLIPFIIVMLILGIFMFFIQTSIVAPFIYTLF